ncbi:MAG: DUF4340 domain-containing protein [Anaerolineae bacterium]|nr:DUF4340 domain-containing protein [Anaerolineae bacterium]
MRLNRGTILLAIALIAIIIVALLVNNNQPDTTTPTAIPTQETVSVFSGLDSTHAVRLSVQNNTSNNGTVLERDANMQWAVTTATGSAEPTENREVDQTVIPGLLSAYAQLASPQSFDSDQLETYGLAIPAYTISLTTDDGTVYTTYVGKTNLSGGRYYAVVNTAPGSGAPAAAPTASIEATEAPTVEPTEISAEATAAGTLEPTATPQPAVLLSGTQTIYLLSTTDISSITALVSTPPYLPLPTSTPTPFPTPNPYSEVEQTATAAVEQTSTAEMIMATLTAMATTTPTSTEAPAMSTPEATLAQSSQATATP